MKSVVYIRRSKVGMSCKLLHTVYMKPKLLLSFNKQTQIQELYHNEVSGPKVEGGGVVEVPVVLHCPDLERT